MTEKKYIDVEAWLRQCSKNWMYMDVAKKIIAQAPAAPVFGQWIDAAEQPPTAPDEYIVMIAGACSPTVLYYTENEDGEGEWYTETEDSTNFYKVTHWMALPAAPGKCRVQKEEGRVEGAAFKKPNVCTCKACGAEIVWIKTVGGKNMPCDAGAERYRLDHKGTATFITERGEVLRGTLDEDGNVVGYVSHFQTCPQADRFRKRGQGDAVTATGRTLAKAAKEGTTNERQDFSRCF